MEFFNNLTFYDENMVCAKSAHTTPHGAIDGKTQTSIIELYNLDVIISVGYRVKSHRGVQFRRWANSVPKDTTQKGMRLPALTWSPKETTKNGKRANQPLMSQTDSVSYCSLKEKLDFNTSTFSWYFKGHVATFEVKGNEVMVKNQESLLWSHAKSIISLSSAT